MNLNVIAHIYTDFPQKFGIPRQSGVVKNLKGRIVFEPEYRNHEAFRGLEEYSHLWVLWHFSEADRKQWSPTVKPPRLGGNKRMGVFATRSPFRPNAIGLSSVRLEKIIMDKNDGPVLIVSGVDMMDRTPIFDIKPYLSYTDSHPDAVGGFADRVKGYGLKVNFPDELLNILPEASRENAIEILAQDPRPAYVEDEMRQYGVAFADYNIRFVVNKEELTVISVELWRQD